MKSKVGGAADRSCASFRSLVARTCVGYGLAAQTKATGKADDCGGPRFGSKSKCERGTWSCLWCESLGQCMAGTGALTAACPQ